ncbi:MAG: FAD-dependent monooxygenase [Pseudomonadota bacterium]
MSEISDVVIGGGGLNGSTLALALASAGLSVVVVEPRAKKVRKNAAFDGRSYALSLGSQRLLSALGVWGDLAPRAQPILQIKITDGRPGGAPSPLMLEFDHAEIDEGPMGYLIEDRYLRRALLDAIAAEPGIEEITGVAIEGQAPGPATIGVTLSDDRQIAARLLVGCDGKTSAIASRAGIRRQGWAYGQTALVCALAHERPHNGTAHQYFMPPGPLAILPLPENRSSIVWTERSDEAARINALPDEGYLNALRPRFGDFLGEISLAGTRFTYPLTLSLATRFHAPRIALVGDAAHAVHPIAGQGLNAGLKDVGALAETLSDARRRGEDIGAANVVARYAQWRRFDTATLAIATDGFNRLFSNDNPILRLGRDLGLGAVNALPALRRGFIREAAGLTGDVPRLLRGLPL